MMFMEGCDCAIWCSFMTQWGKEFPTLHPSQLTVKSRLKSFKLVGYEVWELYIWRESIWSSQNVFCHVTMFQCLQNPSPVVEGIGGGDPICKSSPFKELGSPKPPISRTYSHLITDRDWGSLEPTGWESSYFMKIQQYHYSQRRILASSTKRTTREFSCSEWIKIQKAGKMNLSFCDLQHGGSWKQLEFLLVFCHSPA